MLDPLVSMSFAVYSNKGVYAVLLGSGISRAAGIPTGWEIVLDLIRKIAKLQQEDCEPDPADWYKRKRGKEPDYSELLDEIASKPAERQQLLRSYFEPTEDEREQGLKLPTSAHKAIAQLAVEGYIRVIVTTNFDRLTEKALEDAGATTTVISTPDQLCGALPLTHSGVTVIKLHGDYLDTRIKNTKLELASYDTEMNKRLDQIFDEYGLIICGWSGEWDEALRAAIDRCPNHRFTTYWTAISSLGSKGKDLAERRLAIVVQVKDANNLFESLREKVQALEDMSAPHPLSAKMAVSTMKRYLVDPSSKIRLHDLINEETENLYSEIGYLLFSGDSQTTHEDKLRKRIEKYEALSEILLAIFVTAGYWGTEYSINLLIKSLSRIANLPGKIEGQVYLDELRQYPALLLLYGAGLTAVASGNYRILADVLTGPKVQNDVDKYVEICSEVYPQSVFEEYITNSNARQRSYTPASDILFKRLREPLRDFLPRDVEYQYVFDRFEYLFGLVYADLVRRETPQSGWWGPVGCFAWRGKRYHQGDQASQKIGIEIETEGNNWPPLKAGLFGSSLERVKTVKTKFDSFISNLNFR
jgi:hypothetical protein